MGPALPNLLIIGAAKCGTTSLHFYLDQHPDVFMARPEEGSGPHKEMRLFWRDDWQERLGWYERQFDPGAKVRGEATPSYTHYPYLPDVPRRIHSVIPEARLIYLVRDPIDRIVAHWAQTREDGERASLEQALADYERPDHRLVCASRYATQVERYLEYFPRDRLLVLDMDELRADRLATIQAAFRFIGVDDRYRSAAFEGQLNARGDKRALTGAGAGLWDRVLVPAGQVVPEGIRGRAAPPLRRVLSRQVETPPLPEQIETGLREMLRPEVERLRSLTGKEFASWSM
jgi:hypothetical protein